MSNCLSGTIWDDLLLTLEFIYRQSEEYIYVSALCQEVTGGRRASKQKPRYKKQQLPVT